MKERFRRLHRGIRNLSRGREALRDERMKGEAAWAEGEGTHPMAGQPRHRSWLSLGLGASS